MRSYYKGVARDQYGAIISGATIAIYLAGTTTIASVYTVSTGGTAVNSVTADAEGVFYFYVDTSDYSNIQLFKLVISYLGNTTTYDNISAFYYDNYYIDALGEYGSGTAYTQSTIEAALTAIGTTNKATMLLRPGTWAVTADLTVPANVTLKLTAGAVMQVATGKTLTINGPFEAGLYQVFSGTGTVTLSGSIKEVYPEWWGATTTAGIQEALNSIAPATTGLWDIPATAYSPVVKLSGKLYAVSTPIVIPTFVGIKGAGIALTQIVSSAISGTIMSLGSSATPSYNSFIEDLTIQGQSKNVNGLDIYCVYYSIKNVAVYRCNYHGIYMYDAYSGNLYNVYSRYNATTSSYAGIYMTGSAPGSGENAVSIFGGDVQGSYDNIYIGMGYSVNLNNVTIQSAKRHGIYLRANQDAVNISRCYFEDNSHDYAGANIWGNLTRTTIDGNFFGTMGTNANKLIAATSINGAKITGNIIPGIASPKAIIGMTDETVLEPAYAFIRAYITGNSGPDDASPLFTPALQAIFDTKENTHINLRTTNYVEHLGIVYTKVRFERPPISPALIGAISTSLNDDTATSFTLKGSAAVLVVTSTYATSAGIVFVNPSTPATTIISGGADLEVTTGALAGTTGTNGKTTVSCHTDGKVYVENRLSMTSKIGILPMAIVP